MMPLRKIHAFTLIELLAVIAIIGVLAALLFPSVKSFQEKGNETKCISNLRQMGTAIVNYASDHNTELPINDVNGSLGVAYYWYLALNPYLGRSVSDWRGPSIFLCPSNDPHIDDGNGGIYKLWDDYGYACNLGLMPQLLAVGKYYPDDPNYPFPRPTRLGSMPKHYVLVADTNMTKKGSTHTLYLKGNWPGIPYGTLENARIHHGGVNLLWTDYSVSWMKAEEVVSEAGKTFCWY